MTDTEALLSDIGGFLREEVRPLESLLLAQDMHGLFTELEAMRAKAREKGWWLPQLPKNHGGMGLNLVEHGLLSRVLGSTPLGHYVLGCQAPDAGNMELMLEFASSEQKERWLGPLLRGDIRSCFAMTEPEHAGSNPTMMSTVAKKDGDDWVINGHKWFTTGFDGAAFAIVMAQTAPDAPAKHERASMLIVPTDHPGVEHVRKIPVMGETGRSYLSHSELRFKDCRVPSDALLGPEGGGFALAQTRLGPGRIHHCMRWLGLADRALGMLMDRAKERDLGRGHLADKQSIRHWVAECYAEIEAAHQLVLHTARQIESVGAKAARTEVSIIKFYVAGVLGRVCDRALQVHGALGMTDDTILAWIFRHERAARIYDGADEVHKDVVARQLLGREGAR